MRLIWATRGLNWGFRFLRDGGYADPLPTYDAAFAGIDPAPAAYHRSAGAVAVRFPDPDGRRDSAGRIIPHEFVLFSPLADQVHTVEDALSMVWPLVAAEFSSAWDSTSR